MKEINLGKVNIDLKNPDVSFDDMEFNKVTVLIGMNGTGKSFLFKLNFAITTGMKTICDFELERPEREKQLLEVLNFYFEHSFEDLEATGNIKIEYVDGIDKVAEIEIVLEKGKVTKAYPVFYRNTEEDLDFPVIKYLSSDMRTFDSIKSYLKVRSTILGKRTEEESEKQLTPPEVEKLLEFYKIYNVFILEKMIYVDDIELKGLEKFFGSKDEENSKPIPVKVQVDLEKKDFLITMDDSSQRYATSFSKGEQSVIMMQAAISA